jgi:hypothetical protein
MAIKETCNNIVRIVCEDLAFEVLIAVEVLIMVFWVVMLCSLMGSYHSFGVTWVLKMKVIQSCEMMVTAYKTTKLHIPEDHNH